MESFSMSGNNFVDENREWSVNEEEMNHLAKQQKEYFDLSFQFSNQKGKQKDENENSKEENHWRFFDSEGDGNSFLGNSNHYFSFEQSPMIHKLNNNQSNTNKQGGEEGVAFTPASYFERRSSRMGTLSGNTSDNKRPNFSIQNIESPFLRRENIKPSLQSSSPSSHNKESGESMEYNTPLRAKEILLDYGYTPHKTQLDSPTLHILQKKWASHQLQTNEEEIDIEMNPKELDFGCVSYAHETTKWIEMKNNGQNLLKINCSIVPSRDYESKNYLQMLSSFVISLQDSKLENISSQSKTVDSTLFYLEKERGCKIRVTFKAVDYRIQEELCNYVATMKFQIIEIRLINGREERIETVKRIEMKASVGYARLQMLRDRQNILIQIDSLPSTDKKTIRSKVPMRNSGCIPLSLEFYSSSPYISILPSTFCLKAGQSHFIEVELNPCLFPLPFSGYLLGRDVVHPILFMIPLLIGQNKIKNKS